MTITNAAAQQQLGGAADTLHSIIQRQHRHTSPVILYNLKSTFDAIWFVKTMSESANDIPGYRGLGLEAALNVAAAIAPLADEEVVTYLTGKRPALELLRGVVQ